MTVAFKAFRVAETSNYVRTRPHAAGDDPQLAATRPYSASTRDVDFVSIVTFLRDVVVMSINRLEMSRKRRYLSRVTDRGDHVVHHDLSVLSSELLPEFETLPQDPTNAQYAVQPADVAGNRRRTTLPASASQTHTMLWEPARAYFKSVNSGGGTIDEWTYTARVPKADSDDHRFRLNFWLHEMKAPTDGAEAEIIISNVILPPRPPERLVSAAPLTGAGLTQTFTAVFRHPAGSFQHYLGYLLLLPTPNIGWFTGNGSCLVEYNRISATMRLIDDAGTGSINGGVVGSPGASVSNSRCSVNVAGATAIFSGNDMIVTYPVTSSRRFTS